MPGELTDALKTLDAAIAASLHVRREKLVRAVRNQRIRTWIAYVCAGCNVLFASAAFIYGDYKAGKIIAIMACCTFFFAYLAGKSGRKKK